LKKVTLARPFSTFPTQRRKPNPRDRRGVLVEIDKRYTERAGPLVAGIQKAQTELIASYSDKELETIADLLTRFTENVKQHTTRMEKNLI
jgi:DNA-binding MarR family transcriptional regulator